MAKIGVENKLAAAHAGDVSPLYPLIAPRLRREKTLSTHNGVFWDAAWWGLDNSAVFMAAPPETQTAALDACARGLLNEAYFIEKSGLAYSAKMVLLAKNTDVAQLYALIGADEARHLGWIEPFIDAAEKISPHGPFLAFLSSLIEECSPELLVYLVQVILEGWGLDHYKRLADGCRHPDLAAIFRNIVKDEALHHRSGVMQYDVSLIKGDSQATLLASLKHYADMVRVGPQAALSAIDTACGLLSTDALADVMVALRHETETPRKLALLKELMLQQGMEEIVSTIDFTPLTVTQAVATYQAFQKSAVQA